MISRHALFALAFAASAPLLPAKTITHGPVLGRPGSDTMSIWVRTATACGVRAQFGTRKDQLTQVSSPVTTRLSHDNTGILTLEGLQPDTRYFYSIDTEPPSGPKIGTFRTLPGKAGARHPEHNPEGLFNFNFEFGCGNNQRHADELKVPLETYATMNREIADNIHFSILNGDWLYEEQREFTAEDWRNQTGTPIDHMPAILWISPAIAGVWENYKLYWERAPHLRQWHANVPAFYTVDDHEIVNDVYGCATPGFRNRRAVFRDPAIRAWFDYLAWANPQEFSHPAHMGTAKLEAGSDVLVDENTDFTKLPLDEMANLHVHFGGILAGVKTPEPDPATGDPNHGVYDIVEVLDAHRLHISPAPLKSQNSAYSIGRRTYGSFRISNCEFFLIDTRSHRDLHDIRTPADPKRSMLGKKQLDWLMTSMSESDADFFFVVSTVNFMVPHVGAGGATLDRNEAAGKDDAWTVFLHEREKLIDFWTDEIASPVFVLTGDLHMSFAIRITDRIWEFASGPHNSPNHRSEIDAGGLPPQGSFKYGPRPCDVRWSSYVMNDIEREHRRFPYYCVVQVNNVFNNPPDAETDRWIAYPKPYVMFRFHDGRTGKLRYVETIHAPASEP